LLRSRRWLAGSALGYGGIVLEVLALTTLPLSAVQAAIGAGLVLVAAFAKGPRGRAAPVAAVLAVVALTALYAVAPPLPHARVTPSAAAVIAAGATIGGIAALFARRVPGPIGLALASGVLYGATSLSEAVLAPLLTGARPPLASAVAAVIAGTPLTVAAFLCFQRSLQHGRPLAVVTAMMATMDAVAMAAGLILLGDPLAAEPVARATQIAALALTALSGLLVAGDRLKRPSTAPVAPGSS
jgi:hypothetical protein